MTELKSLDDIREYRKFLESMEVNIGVDMAAKGTTSTTITVSQKIPDDFEPLKKVYCKNCRYVEKEHYEDYFHGSVTEYHCQLEIKEISDAIGRRMIIYTIECHKKNADKDCHDYHRKWWKWWVK